MLAESTTGVPSVVISMMPAVSFIGCAASARPLAKIPPSTGTTSADRKCPDAEKQGRRSAYPEPIEPAGLVGIEPMTLFLN